MRPPFYSDDCYISIVRNADKFIKCYILNISEDYKSAFLKYRHNIPAVSICSDNFFVA